MQHIQCAALGKLLASGHSVRHMTSISHVLLHDYHVVMRTVIVMFTWW